jgi:hypothetical protein
MDAQRLDPGVATTVRCSPASPATFRLAANNARSSGAGNVGMAGDLAELIDTLKEACPLDSGI